MEFKDFTAGQNDDERRLDRVLRKFLEEKSLGEIYKLLRKGLIKLNHSKAKPENRVKAGDIISIAEFLLDSKDGGKAGKVSGKAGKLSGKAGSPSSRLEIVFENQHLLIINKPYDQTVHGEKDGLYKDVLEYYKNNCSGCGSGAGSGSGSGHNTSLSFTPGPLHRLDRRTTGLLVFSKSLEGARWFSEGIKNHTVQKKYYALLTGTLKENCEWQDYIKDDDSAPAGVYHAKVQKESFHKVIASHDDNDNKSAQALSFVKPLAYGTFRDTRGKTPVTLAEFDIKTGRKHQIRAQSALHGHPLLGDTAYGAQALGKDKAANPGGREFYLQAYCLTFPKDNPLELPQTIKTGLSPEFLCQLQYCEIENPGL